MDREQLQAWILNALENAESDGEIDLEDLDAGEAGITVETEAGTFRIVVEEA